MDKPYSIYGQVTSLLAFSAAIEDASRHDAVKQNPQTPKLRGMVAARSKKCGSIPHCQHRRFYALAKRSMVDANWVSRLPQALRMESTLNSKPAVSTNFSMVGIFCLFSKSA